MNRRFETLLPRFSLSRRITVLVLLASLLVVGLVSTKGIPLEMLPSGFTPSFLAVDVPWRDAPAKEVLEKIVLPLEEELSTVRGLDRIISNAYAGRGRCALIFKYGTDMQVAYREVRDRIQRARVRMPSDADRIFIRKHDPSSIPVAFVGLVFDPELTNVYDLIQNEVILRLSRIDGVAMVQANGLEEKEILIEVDRRKVEAAGLNIYELAQELGGDNFSMASGSVRAGDKKLLLRSIARYEDIEELKNQPITTNLRLADIAEIKYEEPEKRFRIRVNSQPAIGLDVMKEGDANTIEVAQAVRDEVERLNENPRLAGMDIEVLFDQGDVILDSLSTLLDSGRIGALFAIAVLFFFLRRLRMTLIITLSIPLSMLIALTVMYFWGETLNVLTLLGLMICVGLLVDNSVVVAENIFRLHKEGKSRRDACVEGAGEIALAITMATLTTVAVFLPVSLVEGQGQFFLLRLAIPVSVSLIASLFVALIFVPLAAYLTLPATGNGKEKGAITRLHERLNRVLARLYEATLGRVNRWYTRVLDTFLATGRWLDMTIVLALIMVSVVALFQTEVIRFTPADEEERAGFEVDVELPQSSTLGDAEEYFSRIEKVLEANKEELGLEGYFFWHTTTFGEIEGWFPTPRTNDLTPRQVAERFLELVPEKPGVKFYTGDESESDSEKESLEAIVLNGDDPDKLEQVGEELETLFAGVEGVLGIKKSGDIESQELALLVDRERAQRQRIDPSTIAGVVAYALRGQSLPKYYRDGREIPVRIRFREEDRESLTELAGFEVPTETGEAVSLSSVTEVSFLPSPQRIRRQNKRLAQVITVELAEGTEEETRERLQTLTANIDLPEGMSFGSSVAARSRNEDAKGMVFAALLSIVFIYLLMAFLFESLILPLSILLTIPLAFGGVAYTHAIAGKNLDFLGLIGVILLIGVVVNNGIVLIDYVNRLRARGMDRRPAILEAANKRFRPIMMTAMTTICGMIPLTFGATSSLGLSYKSFGYTLIGGLTSATLLTLLVVPVAYAMIDDIRDWFTRLIRRALGGRVFGRRQAASRPAETA